MKQLVVAISLVFSLSACALTVDRIDVPYEPVEKVSAVEGAGKVKVTVKSIDARTKYRDRVSSKKNGYGMEMAAIEAVNDIPSTVGRAIETELASQGFDVSSGGKRLDVEVVTFYNDFKMGFFSGDAMADVVLNVSLYRADGQLAYKHLYQAQGFEPNIQLSLGHNARIALMMAFRNAVADVVRDQGLRAALLGS